MTSSKNKPVLKYSHALVGSEIPNLTTNSKNLKEENRPLAIVYGWMGSQHKNLNKYVEKWNEKGFNTFSYSPSTLETFMPHYRGYQIKYNMLPIIKNYIKEHPQCQGIIFHCFSNGGGFYYSEITHEIVNNPEFQHIHQFMKGTVFDSLPSLSMKAGLRAARISGGLIISWIVKIFIYPLMLILMGNYWKTYQYNLAHPKNQWPHLMIYSKDDDIVTPDQVEILTKVLKEEKSKLYIERCFDKSPHVCHLRTHPKEYLESLDTLTKKILEFSTTVN